MTKVLQFYLDLTPWNNLDYVIHYWFWHSFGSIPINFLVQTYEIEWIVDQLPKTKVVYEYSNYFIQTHDSVLITIE